MSITEYAGFMAVTVAAILLILRACYFLFVCKNDPLKAVVPRLNWFQSEIEKDKDIKIIAGLS